MKICKNLYELSSLSKWKKQRKPTCVFPYTALLASSSSLTFAPLFLTSKGLLLRSASCSFHLSCVGFIAF